MAIELKGPIKDNSLPLIGQLHKWKFKNMLGEDIFSLNITIGPFGKAPTIRRILFNINEESILYDTFSEPQSCSLKINDLFPRMKSIKNEQDFDIEIAFSGAFTPENFVQFSPVSKRGVNIVAALPSDDQKLAQKLKNSLLEAAKAKVGTSTTFKPPFTPLISEEYDRPLNDDEDYDDFYMQDDDLYAQDFEGEEE